MFWIDQKLEPKRAFRFTVKMTGIDGDATLFFATKASKPQLTISETEHKYLNHNFYFPARATWEPVTLSLVDPANPDVMEAMMSTIEISGYVIPGNSEVLRSISKNNAVNAAGDIIIEQLDADGNPIETWTLRNAWISKVAPAELSYDSEELSTMEVTVRYDYAELHTATNRDIFKSTTTV